MGDSEALSTPTPGIQHAPNLYHSWLPVPKHVVDRSLTGKQGASIGEHDPSVRPSLPKVNVQGFIDADDE
jgi:hypothetical protein